MFTLKWHGYRYFWPSYSILHVVCHSITVNRKRSTYKSTSYITTAYKLFSTILGEVLYRQAEIWESCMVEEGGGPPNFLYKAHGNWTTWCNFGLFLFGQCYISGQTQGPSAIPGMAVRSQLYCISSNCEGWVHSCCCLRVSGLLERHAGRCVVETAAEQWKNFQTFPSFLLHTQW